MNAPDVPNPGASNPGATRLGATRLDATTPGATKPDVTKPGVTMPGVTRPGVTRLDATLLTLIHATKGFMPDDEGAALHAAALSVNQNVVGPFLEVGAYCGRSAVYLGDAARRTDRVLYSLDHHHGSEENQSGWEHHDTEVVDPLTGRMDTLPFFRRTIESAGLESSVVALVGPSIPVARHWSTPLALLFIDGGHGKEPAAADYAWWTPKVAPGGLLVIHDVFPNPADGGRPPYEDIYLPALNSGLFTEDPTRSCGSLRVLQRVLVGTK